MTQRVAAALLLTRGSGALLEVFVVERAAELRYFGGYQALPGGTLVPGDGDATADEAAAIQRCALRELFEETGLLLHALPAGRDDAARASGLRAAMLQRERADGRADAVAPWRELIAGAPAPPPLRALGRV